MSSIRRVLALSFGIGTGIFASPAMAQENVMVVFDGSNSMWGQIDGTAKIEIARDVMDTLLGSWAEDRQVGLMAYGHREKASCKDIEVLVQPGAGSKAEILKQVDGITPRGRTPLTDAVEQAARQLAYTDQPATVVLISDGVESCDRDPCALAAALEKGGVGFTAHVVGFGLSSKQDRDALSCIADETGGIFVAAGNASELEEAMGSVSAAVAEVRTEPEATPTPEPTIRPKSRPEPKQAEVTLTGPDLAIGGSQITVSWTPTVNATDYVTIVPAGAKPNAVGPYFTVREDSKGDLTVPGQAGLYEIRYLVRDVGVVAKAPLEVAKPQVTLGGPETAITGASFEVTWTPTINRADYVTIAPAGSDSKIVGSYLTVRDDNAGKLVAPASPGLYELRYLLRVDNMIVASRPIEVTAPEVVVNAPESALRGSKFTVSWAGTVNAQDYITIVPAGAPEGEFGNYISVRDDTQKTLQAPADAGLYEVRYVLKEGRKTMASAPIEITEPQVTLNAPETAAVGTKFLVGWAGTVSSDDYVTIVPAGEKEGEFGNYFSVRENLEKELQAPAEPGLYEVRYVLKEGRKTMASAPIEITQAQVTVSAPGTAKTGERFDVTWDGQLSTEDYITIVPIGAPEGEFGNYFSVRKHESKALRAPTQTGMYEVRYVLNEGRKTMATTTIEVIAADVSIDAPAEVRVGDKLTVSWVGTVDFDDYIVLAPMGSPNSDFSDYASVRDYSERSFDAPETEGLYELRYVLKQDNKVLARRPIEVVAANAALNTGATLSAPESGAPGSKIEVSWTAEASGADQRITLATPEQAIFTWISAEKIAGKTSVQITLPDEVGAYELRFLDVSNQAVLARQIVTVE